jgi:hypothetical protein
MEFMTLIQIGAVIAYFVIFGCWLATYKQAYQIVEEWAKLHHLDLISCRNRVGRLPPRRALLRGNMVLMDIEVKLPDQAIVYSGTAELWFYTDIGDDLTVHWDEVNPIALRNRIQS